MSRQINEQDSIPEFAEELRAINHLTAIAPHSVQ